MSNHPPRCQGRASYARPEDAQRVLDRIQARPIDPTDPLDHYRPNAVRSCEACDYYHLTSKTGKRWAKGKKSPARQIKRRN